MSLLWVAARRKREMGKDFWDPPIPVMPAVKQQASSYGFPVMVFRWLGLTLGHLAGLRARSCPQLVGG